MSRLTPVAESIGVWQPEAGLSNSAVISGPTGALCVDVQARPSLGRDLREAITRRYGAVETVVLTHGHADHILGAAAFEGLPTIAHRATAAFISERGESERQLLQGVMVDHAEELADAPLPHPDTLVDDRLEVAVGGRTVELLPVGPAHTPGDLVVLDAATRVMVAGDVAFNGIFPVLRDADSAGWTAALEYLIDLAPTQVIPGHGPVGTAACLAEMLELLSGLRAAVEEAMFNGARVEDLAAETIVPSRFRTLKRLDRAAGAVATIARGFAAHQSAEKSVDE